jgi:hypothetical protein
VVEQTRFQGAIAMGFILIRRDGFGKGTDLFFKETWWVTQ